MSGAYADGTGTAQRTSTGRPEVSDRSVGDRLGGVAQGLCTGVGAGRGLE